ncbi:hypothetical protein Goari_005573, partial [Gossypium aridum]|nr:hypothetical protein [Gossypium aridum]
MIHTSMMMLTFFITEYQNFFSLMVKQR